MKKQFVIELIPLIALATSCSSEREQLLYDLSYIPVYSETDSSYTYFDLSKGKKAEDARSYDCATYFYDGIAIILERGKDGHNYFFINSKFEPISNEKWQHVTFFNNGCAWAAQENGTITAIKKDGTIAFTLPEADKTMVFNDGVSVFCVGDRYRGYKCGLVNTSGKILIKPDQFVMLGPYGYNRMIKAGVLTKSGLRYGIVDYDGEEIIPFEYEDIEFTAITANNKAFPVSRNGEWGVVNLKNEEIIAPLYSEITPQKNGNYICSVRFGSAGYISNRGKELIPQIFKYIEPFTYGNHTPAVGEDEYSAGIIDETGKFIVGPEFHMILEFEDNGLAIFEREGRRGKRGLMDLDGNVISPDKYERLSYIGEGLYIATLDGECGLINSKGKTIISFIGEYSPANPYFRTLDAFGPVECVKKDECDEYWVSTDWLFDYETQM